MKSPALSFNSVLEAIYGMSVEDRMEIKNLLEHNIADSRREEIVMNYKKSLEEQKLGKLKFSSNISELKEML